MTRRNACWLLVGFLAVVAAAYLFPETSVGQVDEKDTKKDERGKIVSHLRGSLVVYEPVFVHGPYPYLLYAARKEDLVQLKVSYYVKPPLPKTVTVTSSNDNIVRPLEAVLSGGLLGLGQFSVFLKASRNGDAHVDVKVVFDDGDTEVVPFNFRIGEERKTVRHAGDGPCPVRRRADGPCPVFYGSDGPCPVCHGDGPIPFNCLALTSIACGGSVPFLADRGVSPGNDSQKPAFDGEFGPTKIEVGKTYRAAANLLVLVNVRCKSGERQLARGRAGAAIDKLMNLGSASAMVSPLKGGGDVFIPENSFTMPVPANWFFRIDKTTEQANIDIFLYFPLGRGSRGDVTEVKK